MVQGSLRDLAMKTATGKRSITRETPIRLADRGDRVIREWYLRERGRGMLPSLADADLSGQDLSSLDLEGVDLSRANLSRADLRLPRLRGTDLSRADLSRANLSNADLSDAILHGTLFQWTALHGAVFSGAQFGATLFADVDLSVAIGLDRARHRGPSTFGLDTAVRSSGGVPEKFLRGCGVPDAVIGSLPSLITLMQPVQFYSCFLCHSSDDKQFARRLHSRMRDEGLRVWFDEVDMQAGSKLDEQIDKAIRMYDRLLLVLSPHSMNSEWVKAELRKAFEQERREGKRKLFPISLVPYAKVRDWKCFDADHGRDLAVEVREYFIPDFTNWNHQDAFEAAFGRLLRDLKAKVPPKLG